MQSSCPDRVSLNSKAGLSGSPLPLQRPWVVPPWPVRLLAGPATLYGRSKALLAELRALWWDNSLHSSSKPRTS